MTLAPDKINQIAAFARKLDNCVNSALRKKFDRPMSDLTALISIKNCNSFNIGWLSNVLELSHSAAVRVVDRLEADGLLERQAKDNKKQVGLRISQKGIIISDEILSLRGNVVAKILSSLESQQLDNLADSARTVIASHVDHELDAYKTCALCDEEGCGVNCPTAAVVSCLPKEKCRS
jgi:DNA-binding MarR family transcriptional regulator